MNWLQYLTDPLFRGPTLGSTLMCLATAVVGVMVVLRKRSLLGETLSHAAYPGVLLALTCAAFFLRDPHDDSVLIFVFCGAALAAWAALLLIEALERRRVRPDSALCFVLSAFFGIGLLLASRLQIVLPRWYLQAQSVLFGQTATMTDRDVWIYLGLVAAVVCTVTLFFKELQVVSFDAEFAKTLGQRTKLADALFTVLLVCAIVIGMRGVGVVLMSAMLIIPAITARQFCHRMPSLLILSGGIGALAGCCGTILSVEGSSWLGAQMGRAVVLATGPSIVLVAASLCFLALLFAPERGLIAKTWRMATFRMRCLDENLMKLLWRRKNATGAPLLAEVLNAPLWWIYWRLHRLTRGGWLRAQSEGWQLTEDGRVRATRIVRLHRLWELYLTDYLGLGVERVHRNAEEIEHILTPDLEERLEELLQHPLYDPHKQPIPPRSAL